jgi:predicted nucleotidyltransferase
VDPRSATGRSIASPAGALAELPGGPERFSTLLAARASTAARLDALREKVAHASLPDSTALVLFGSWGRGELTGDSDIDWALVVDDPDLALDDPRVVRAVETVRLLLEDEGAPPGGQQMFGGAFHAWRLVEHIGLAEDDSANLTRRMLLLLESVAVTGPDIHEHVKRRVLERYLSRQSRSHRPPRFLLNDIIRYWRTIAVDFEGKVAQDTRAAAGEDKFVMRNAKLRTSRKVLYVSGLLPVLLCHYVRASDMVDFLDEQFAEPATDRLARAFLHLGLAEPGARTLGAYEEWIALQSDTDNRAVLEALTEETRDTDPVFATVRRLGNGLDNGLLALLHETELGPVTRRYVTI